MAFAGRLGCWWWRCGRCIVWREEYYQSVHARTLIINCEWVRCPALFPPFDSHSHSIDIYVVHNHNNVEGYRVISRQDFQIKVESQQKLNNNFLFSQFGMPLQFLCSFFLPFFFGYSLWKVEKMYIFVSITFWKMKMKLKYPCECEYYRKESCIESKSCVSAKLNCTKE